MIDKRRHVRVRRRLKVLYGERQLEHSGFTGDISAGGVFVISSQLPPLDTRLHLQICRDDQHSVCLEGLVRRHKHVPLSLRAIEKGGFGVRAMEFFEVIPELLPPGIGVVQKSKRFSVEIKTQVELQRMFNEQIRRGGLFIRSDWAAERLSTVEIEIKLGFLSSSKAFVFEARVIHVIAKDSRTNVPAGVGLEFVDAKAVESALAHFLQ